MIFTFSYFRKIRKASSMNDAPILPPNQVVLPSGTFMLPTVSQVPVQPNKPLVLTLAPDSRKTTATTNIKIVPSAITTTSTSSMQFNYTVWKKGVRTDQTKQFTQPVEGKWFNLGTGRTLSKQSTKMTFIISDNPNYPRIAGTREQLDDFFKLNPKVKRDLRAEGVKTTKTGPSVRLGWFQRYTEKHKNLQKITDLVGITSKAVREGIVTKYDDPAKLTPAQVNQLGIFTLEGLNGKFVVSDIYDGDTFNVVFYISMKLFSETVEKRKGVFRRALGTSQKGGYFNKQKCRLFGWDSQEHEHYEGLCSAVILLNTLKGLNGIIYGKIGNIIDQKSGRRAPTFGKFGRVLVDFYLDPIYKRKLTTIYENYKGRLEELEKYIKNARLLPGQKNKFINALNDYRREHPGPFILGKEYYGDTKSDELKSVNKMPSNLVNMFYSVFKHEEVFVK